LDCFPLSVY